MDLLAVQRLFQKPELGLFILRVSLGVIMIIHGVPKFLGGEEVLKRVGGAMAEFGITFLPQFWGFMAAAAEVGGGLLLIVGFLFRPAVAMLFFVMLTAAMVKHQPGMGIADFNEYAHPFTLMFVFLAMLFTGPGKMSLQKE